MQRIRSICMLPVQLLHAPIAHSPEGRAGVMACCCRSLSHSFPFLYHSAVATSHDGIDCGFAISEPLKSEAYVD